MTSSRKLGKTGLAVSPLALGTVELGYAYGIGPRNLPNEQEAISLLLKAVEEGITLFDTAHFYGCAEERIEKSGITRMPQITIVTKCGHGIEKNPKLTALELEKMVRHEVDQSRKTLGLDTLSVVMMHGGSVKQIQSGMISEIMQKLKDEHKIQHCGISTRGTDAPAAAMVSDFFEVLQMGYSIFDQRIRSTVLPEAQLKNVGVMARSALLKGALTPACRFLPKELERLKTAYIEIEQIARDTGTDVPTLALQFALTENAISSVLIGTNKKENLDRALAAYNKGPLSSEIINILSRFAFDDTELVDPAHWPPTAVSDEKSGQKIAPHLYEKK